MPKFALEVGNKITLRLIKRGNVFSTKPVDGTSYNSSLLHINSENELLISVPLVGGSLLSMGQNDIYFIRFFTRNGLYQSKCYVSGKGLEGHIAYVKVKLIANLERHQRREYYRLECRINLTWAKLNEVQAKLYEDLKNAVTDARKRLIKEQIKMEDIAFSRRRRGLPARAPQSPRT